MTDSSKLSLYLAHRQALLDYASSIAGNRAHAEDVVQEAWLRFQQAADASQNPLGYLYRIVRNLALDLTRRRAVEREVQGGDEHLQFVPCGAPSPEVQACDQDALRVMSAALAELPERTRRAFELHRLGGATLQEVATQMGLSIGLVHALVRDALTYCAERLGDLLD